MNAGRSTARGASVPGVGMSGAEESGCRLPRRARLGGAATFLPALAFALLPKCPMCWASYMAVLGATGISVPYQPWLLPAAGVVLVASLAGLHRGPSWRAWRGNGPFLLGVGGAVLLLLARLAIKPPAVAIWAGVFLVVGAALWSWPRRSEACGREAGRAARTEPPARSPRGIAAEDGRRPRPGV
jgi:hypothetical protein